MTDEERLIIIDRAERMRRLSPSERDDLIAAAGDIVIDRREYFADRQKQVDLARAYRLPRNGGVA